MTFSEKLQRKIERYTEEYHDVEGYTDGHRKMFSNGSALLSELLVRCQSAIAGVRKNYTGLNSWNESVDAVKELDECLAALEAFVEESE